MPNRVLASRGAAVQKWLPQLPTEDDRAAIVAFPYAGGGPSVFRGWEKDLVPHRLRLCPVALPGKEKRQAESLPEDIGEVAQDAAAAILAHIHTPYVLLGLCFGASLAYLTAKATAAAGRPPSGLIVVGGRAPHTPPPVPVSTMSDESFIDTLADLGFVSDVVLQNRELLDLYLPMLYADFCMDEKFIVDSVVREFSFPVLSLYGVNDSITPESSVKEWNRYSTGRFAMQTFDGDQLFFVKEHDAFIGCVANGCISLIE